QFHKSIFQIFLLTHETGTTTHADELSANDFHRGWRDRASANRHGGRLAWLLLSGKFMKIKNLHVVNIGMIADETVEFNQPLILFYGAIRQGKSSFLNAVRWVFGGAFPSDIIRHGQTEASIQLTFENGYLKREFYYSEDKKEIKSRPLVLVLDGAKVPRPVDKLKAMLNPFLLDQDHLVRMTELDRKKYFAELFHTATPELDAEAARA